MENAEDKLSARRWYGMMRAPDLVSATPDESGCSLRRFQGGAPEIIQPALIEHVVAIHLGGAKRVRRWQGARCDVFDVDEDSITLMPAGSPNRWMTEGPIHYAHLVIGDDMLREAAREEFDRDPGDLTLVDKVGAASPVISSVFRSLLRRVEAADAGRLYRQHAASMIVLDLLRNFSSLSAPGGADAGRRPRFASGGLAAWQLRRLIDHLRADLRRDADASAMARLIGVSRGHLFRAFKASTGVTPLQFVNRLRVDRATSLLRIGGMPLADIAVDSGFHNERHMAVNLRLETGFPQRRRTQAAGTLAAGARESHEPRRNHLNEGGARVGR